jgi:hypothetical protein
MTLAASIGKGVIAANLRSPCLLVSRSPCLALTGFFLDPRGFAGILEEPAIPARWWRITIEAPGFLLRAPTMYEWLSPFNAIHTHALPLWAQSADIAPSSRFSEWFSEFNEFHVGAVAIIAGVMYAIISSVLKHLHKVRKAELEATLKDEMIRRGMSANDIAQVLKASSTSGGTASPPGQPPVAPR